MADLTPHQQQAFDVLYARLLDGARYTTLRGFAGTGKTFLIGQLVGRLLAEGRYVRACAPTHKAAQVLHDKVGRQAVRAQTIHSFLGLRLAPDGQGGYRLEPERGRRLPGEGLVVVDEASMIGAAEWEYIDQAANLQWLFVGDPAQLPPVNEAASPIFELPGPALEEVVRQGRDNPILDLATRVRNQEPGLPEARYTGTEGVAATRRRPAFLASAIRAFASEAYREDAALARVLAYRNRTVRAYNRQIRDALYGRAAPRFVEGEWLVACDTWFHDTMPYLINSEEVRITSTSVEEVGHLEGEVWKVWVLEVEGHDDAFSRYLTVLHEDEAARFQRKLQRLKEAAIKGEQDWQAFYELKERFARVDYAYATTIHKCLPLSAGVETAQGRRPIGTLRPGELVWTGRGRLRPVTGVFRTGLQEEVRITTTSGAAYTASPAHRFLTARGWQAAGTLGPDDALATARPRDPYGLPVPEARRVRAAAPYVYDRVDRVVFTGRRVPMMDIEVAEDHSFLYEGAVVHNSQGSTFHTAFVDYRDTLACRGADRQALLYVAVTRPSSRLALLV